MVSRRRLRAKTSDRSDIHSDRFGVCRQDSDDFGLPPFSIFTILFITPYSLYLNSCICAFMYFLFVMEREGLFLDRPWPDFGRCIFFFSFFFSLVLLLIHHVEDVNQKGMDVFYCHLFVIWDCLLVLDLYYISVDQFPL